MNTALSKRPNPRRDSASRLEGAIAGVGDRGRVATAAIASLDVEPERRGLKCGTGRSATPVGGSRGQKLMRLTRHPVGKGFSEEILDSVTFVPMLTGIR